MAISKSDKERITAAFKKVTKNFTELLELLATAAESNKEKKKIIDPNAPKRNLSSYMLYYKTARVDLAAKTPNLKAVEMARQIGDKWNSLSDKEKQPYIKQAAKDKARFDKETKDYKATLSGHKRKADEEKGDETPTKRKAKEKKSKKSSDSKKTSF